MEQRAEQQVAGPLQSIAGGTVFPVLLSISFSHLLNDTIQSLIPSIYPLVKASFHLSFSQVGLITLTFQLAASLLQPFVGYYTDKKPQPFSLATGMGFTLAGLILLSFAQSFHWLLASVAMIGIGSSVFHPEASKVAYMASGGRRGLAQSIFQVGGNAGSSMGPPAGSSYCSSLWTSPYCLVLYPGSYSYHGFSKDREMVPAKYAQDKAPVTGGHDIPSPGNSP
jgi:MFS transporter, FSR family, fosmidomycin resistance protein